MILRKLQWILLSKLLCSVIIVESENERSYDTNDWIPITPSPDASGEDVTKKAAGRVLNLDSPVEKFFPEDDYSYRKRKPQTQQYLRETSLKPSSDRQKHRNSDKHRFEAPQQTQQSAPTVQYFTNQELATYEQPPPLNQGEFLEKPILTRQQAPAVDAPNLYEQYNLPFNNSFYQSLNPTSINAELQEELQNPNIVPPPLSTNGDDKQSVQLLYVPLENLKSNPSPTQATQDSQTIYHQVNAPNNQIYSQNKQHLIDDIEHDLIQQTVQAHRLQQQIHLGRPVVLQATTTTTTAPTTTKRKPHQPPLAVYLASNNGASTDDVLSALRDAKTIAVQDAILPNSPRVFIGPSTLNLPLGYNRFPLPYINKLEGNRIERKIENLSFFVAPLSYKAPPGYSKIPLPSPHVGSVVVSNKEDSHKRSAPRPTPSYPNQINDYESTKPSHSAPVVGNANSQIFDPNQQTYYSTTPFQNPVGDGQNPHYLQFSVNENVNQFAVPPKSVQEQQLPQPQLNINNIPPRSQVQVPATSGNLYRNPEPVSYNQANNVNTSPQTTLQQAVPDITSIPYSSPQGTVQEDQNKYNFNQNQNVNSYQIPSRTLSPVSNPNHESVNSYQIPVEGTAGVTQYNQPIEDKKQEYSIPQTFSNENSNSYHIPSRNIQKTPSTVNSLQNTGSPARTTTSHYDEPLSSFLSSPFEDEHEINITPKTTTTSKTRTEESSQYPFGSGQKKQNALNLAINQYELHQINSQLLEGTTKKGSKSPYDFDSHFHYDDKPPKDFDYSSQFEVEKSKSKGKYDYTSIFDVDVDKPKFDYNSRFEHYSSTPASILRDTFEEIPTSPRTSLKSRRRGKPTRQPARTTTTEKESYTVLEEFSAKPVTTPQITDAPKVVKFASEYKTPTQVEVADVPANVYRIRTTPKYDNVDVGPVTTQYNNVKTVVEDIPTNVYNLNLNQNTPVYTNPPNQQVPNHDLKDKQIVQNNFGKNEEVSHPPTYVQSPLTEVSYVPQYKENPIIEPLVQNRGQKQPESAYNFEGRQPDLPDYTSNLQDQSIRTVVAPNLLVPTTEHHQATPNFEAPVEQYTTTATTTTTTTTTTTGRPSTTQATRGRGRQRGGSRFSAVSATTASVPRRNANRRRPVHSSRTTTESSVVQYSSREDIQKVNPRQRLRTRTRSNQPAATERISSTENEVRSYKEPTSETPLEFLTNPTSPQSYMKIEHAIEDQKVVIQPEDASITDYTQYYNPQPAVTVTESPRFILQYDNTATTQYPVMDIQITHTAPAKIKKQPVVTTRPNEEAQIHLQAGGVLHNNNNINNNNNGNEGSPNRQTSRVRGRGRNRARVATTTTEKPVARTTARPAIRVAPKRTTTTSATTTTQKSTVKSATDEEFFGFIRQPNFNQIYNIQIPAATQQPIQIYQNTQNLPTNNDVKVSTYQAFGGSNKNPNVRAQSYQIPQNQPQVDDVRLDFNSAPFDATTVHFLGEIRPKYRPTTQNYEEIITVTDAIETIRPETETPRSRTRGRVRNPQRQSTVRQSNNEVSTYRTQPATRRSNVIRSRGRGNVHYRAPENGRQKDDKDADVEGGNYPSSFFQNRQAVVAATVPATTNTPIFQISIDPGNEDYYADQLPNPSLFQPNILPRPDQWTEATEHNVNNEEYAPANQLNDDIHLEKETVSPDEPQVTEYPKEHKALLKDTKNIEQPEEGNTNEGQTTDQPIALPVIASKEQATQNSDEAYKDDAKAMEELFEEVNKTEKPRKSKGRRRGVWKLVKQRPLDPYEAAESQNYYSVVNTFGDIAKVKDKLNFYGNERNKEYQNLGHHQLYNNYNPVLEQNSETYEYESHKLPSTDRPEQQTNKFYELFDLNSETEKTVVEASPTTEPEDQDNVNSTESDIKVNTTNKESSIFDTIYDMFGISDKSEDVKEPPPTTISSTEPETVPPVTTTVISPTFPEEITEIPTTTHEFLEHVNNSTDAVEQATEKIETTSPGTQITRTFDVEPWEMKAVRTSTSTEISHETEICYKGRCVKSTDRTRL